MKLDQIQIRTTDEKIDLNITSAQVQLQSTPVQVKIEQPAAILEIHSKAAKLLIDQSQAWRDLGLYTPLEAGKNIAKKGMQDVAAGIARRASEGNQLMQIENGGDALNAIAKQSQKPLHPQMAIKWAPSVGAVKIKYAPGLLDINITAQKPKFDVRLGDVSVQYTAGDVTGTRVQKADVETTVIKGG